MSKDYDETSGSGLGGFGHAETIEPGAVEGSDREDDDRLIDVPELPDPEGLAGAHDDEDESS
ncbi:MAG: hypothetical protein JWM76_2695 [Pseudonocardiales bacterium]|nr:hypothetical protein [Pseudonocardiales bacterium]